ncbi:MAG: hypothetical protein AB1482_13510, partial [Pseudomonadota bacterium]
FLVVMVCPPYGFKVDLDNQPLTMTTRPLPTPGAFAHKSAHYPLTRASIAGSLVLCSLLFMVCRLP